MRILLIEDDPELAAYMAKGLRQEGHVADLAPDGREGLLMASTEDYEVLVVDRMLPGLEGIALIKTLRAAGCSTPVLIVSALGEVDDRVKGLRGGGDDYLVKPFAFAELLARIEALARRREPALAPHVRLTARGVVMDLLARKVTVDGDSIELQSREFRLLEYMLRHKGQVVTRTMLLENVWDYHFDPQTNVIDVHISRLRRKLERDGQAALIKTVRGAGYLIDDTG